MIDFSLSVLPHLEPFAGIAFALNLAYIGLPRFRYRNRIQVHVAGQLKEIDGEPHQFKDTDWYKGPARLALLKDDDTDISKAELPQESWAKGYAKLFEHHRDKQISILLSSLLGAFLALGSAHSAGHYGSVLGFNIMPAFSDGLFHVWFVSLCISALTPVYFVYRGNGVVEGACLYADKRISGMKTAKKALIADLQIPPVPGATKNTPKADS